jgi:energy-coupling factor transport system substrate-specific component
METRTNSRSYASLSRHPAVIVIGVLLLAFFNAGADYVNDRALHIPLFLDTIGTLLATVLFGLLPGVAAAVATHLFLELLNGPSGLYLPWMACSISSAVILWWLIRRGAFETPLHALLAALWIALANALIGAMVAALLFTGDTGHAVDYVASALYALGQGVFSAAFLARLPVNVADKAIAVFVAFLSYRLLRNNPSGRYLRR